MPFADASPLECVPFRKETVPTALRISPAPDLPITFREETKTANVTILLKNKKYVNLKTYIIIIYFY